MKIILLILIGVIPLWGASQVGVVTGLDGQVFRKKSGKIKFKPLTVTTPVFKGDEIRSARGVAKINFNDDSNLFISSNSKVVISDYLLNPQKKKRVSLFHLIAGKIKMKVSKHYNDNRFEIKTTTATLGVRGTEIILVVTPQENRYYVLEGIAELKSEMGRFTTMPLTQNQFASMKGDGLPVIENLSQTMRIMIDQGFTISQKSDEKSNQERFKGISAGKMDRKADGYLRAMKGSLKRAFAALSKARKDKNIMRLNCINDNVMTIKAYLRRSEDNKAIIDDYISRDQLSEASVVLVKIYDAYNQSKQADVSIQSCSGTVMTYKGDKEIKVEVDVAPVAGTYLDSQDAEMSLEFKSRDIVPEKEIILEPVQISPYF